MNDVQLMAIMIGLLSIIFGLLMAVLGWIGNKLYLKVEDVNKSIQVMASELHTRINNHESRLTRIETIEDSCPVNGSRRRTDKTKE